MGQRALRDRSKDQRSTDSAALPRSGMAVGGGFCGRHMLYCNPTRAALPAPGKPISTW
jgi:hypothetical protein